MIKLAKNNPIIKDIKELQKKTVNDLVYVDDLSSIKTIEGTNNVIDTFIYCDELQYHDDTKKLIDALIKKAHHSYTISKQTYEYLRQKENTAGLICTVLFKNHILDDFKNKENPSLYLSRNLKFTKVYPESGKNYYFIISDNEFKGMCTDLFDKLWNARTDIIISNKDEILDRIAKSISYTRLISESFGENIE